MWILLINLSFFLRALRVAQRFVVILVFYVKSYLPRR